MRDRLALPFLLPLLVAGAIFVTIFSFGHVLLEAFENNDNLARGIAIAAGAVILLVASILANRPRVSGWMVYVATALPAAIILGAGMFYLVRPSEEHGAEATAAAIAPPGPLVSIATDNRFSETEYTIVAAQQYTLNFSNNGVALHNWHLRGVPGADGRDVQTALLPGGQSETLNFTVQTPGEYTFICDVHPVEMVGTLTVLEAGAATGGGAGPAAGPAGTSPGPTTISNIATDNKFALTELVANANEATTLTLTNRGSAIHNLHILGVKGADGRDITTPLSPGGKVDTITFTIATAGTYDFLCDVHPVEMRGKITVR